MRNGIDFYQKLHYPTTMQYLKISNPGLTAPQALTMIGVSTSVGCNEKIGMFGSGGKYSIALLLRKGLQPVITVGNLKMEFFTKEIFINGKYFNQVYCHYSGKDHTGATRNYDENLNFTLEWGAVNWNTEFMAVREWVSNSFDECINQGLTFKDAVIEIVDSPRAKKDWTCVFIPLNAEIQAVYDRLSFYFLHYRNPDYIKQNIIPKLSPDSDYIYFYKKGVLATKIKGYSLFDYNLDYLELDESRNANEWDVRYAVSSVLKDADVKYLSQIISKSLSQDIWESTLDYGIKGGNKDNWQKAFKNAVGENAVLTRAVGVVQETVKRKGFSPVTPVSDNFRGVLESYAVPTDITVLNSNEVAGREIKECSIEFLDKVFKVWGWLERNESTFGKKIPDVKSFNSKMDAESNLHGYYQNDCIYLHQDLAGKELISTILEEIVHYLTNSTDNSRDFQEFFIRLVSKFID